jgi:hypothetical protein
VVTGYVCFAVHHSVADIGVVWLFLNLSKLTSHLSISVSNSEIIDTGLLIPSLNHSLRIISSIEIQGIWIFRFIVSSVSFP